MNNLIIAFIGIAIVLGVATLVISGAFNAIELPTSGGTTTIPAVTPPLPTEIPDLVAWFDADDGDTISIGVGVSQWDDKSGEGNHVTQSTGTSQPTVLTNAKNGHDALAFDGSDDYIDRSTFTGGAISHPFTWLIVYKQDILSPPTQAHMSSSTNWVVSQNSRYYYYSGAHTDTGYVHDTDWHYARIVFDTASSEFYEDGVLLKTANIGTNTMNGVTLAVRVSPLQHFDGNISEVIVYDKVLTTDEANDMRDYIETKYDLGMTITGTYSDEVIIPGGEENAWAPTQTLLNTQTQTATALLVLTLIVIAAVVIISYSRRMN